LNDETTTYVLHFSHQIIEHLGIKLYQNRPTNVIAELVSNSWDAEAGAVWIDFEGTGEKRLITVGDSGNGMSGSSLRDSYLVIGKPKRPKDKPEERTPNLSRMPMGRKGIGKLAPFGIAGKIHLVTIAGLPEARAGTWLELDVPSILAKEPLDGGAGSYKPNVLCSEAAIDSLQATAKHSNIHEVVERFLNRIDGGTGTLIVMANLSTKRAIDPIAVKQSIGRRFTVTLLREDFKVFVDDARVSQADALPDFAFMVGEPAAPLTHDLQFSGQLLPLRYWAGFVKEAQWPQDQAGVGVYAHGKVAQDRPFTFGIKGSEIFTRYMYAVVEADWLDELPEDLVSTDRTNVDWEHPAADALKSWGETQVRAWVTQYQKFKKEADKTKNRERVKKSKDYLLSDTETDAIADLIGEISPTLGNDEAAQERAVESLAAAWVHKPMRDLAKRLWDNLRDSPDGGGHFVNTIEKLRDSLVPESLSLAVTFAQRVYALTLLYKRIHEGTETDLQHLIERFPWILDPDMEKLTANQQLKTVIAEAEAKGQLKSAQIEASPADALKPDFVFFSPPGEVEHEIQVVELKNPGQQHHLTAQNELQLVTYMTYIGVRYPNAKLRGKLIGNNYLHMTSKRTDLDVLDWSQVLARSRKGHIELLASMLIGANPNPNDSRVAQVAQYGGKETTELLKKLAEHDEELAQLVAGLK
jgi:hypothetical protein